MNFVFIGKPFAGKGTYAQYLKEVFDLVQISTGDVLREVSELDSELGKQVKDTINKGDLVNDELISKILQEKLSKITKGVILDGYPRNIEQAKTLESFFKIDYVIYFNPLNKTIIDRITKRRTCSNCGRIFHTVNIIPRVQGICDYCNGKLSIRKDNNIEAIQKRLDLFDQKTSSLINFYREKGILKTFDDNRPFLELKEDLRIFFENLINNKQ